MTLQQMKYAVITADKGTMSEDAQSLFIMQSSLTNAIKELETELDITISHRTNKAHRGRAVGGNKADKRHLRGSLGKVS